MNARFTRRLERAITHGRSDRMLEYLKTGRYPRDPRDLLAEISINEQAPDQKTGEQPNSNGESEMTKDPLTVLKVSSTAFRVRLA